MDKSRSAITAIRNIKKESFVASTLDHIGWTLLHRATDSHGLAIATNKYPDAIVIAADDFTINKSGIVNSIITLDSKEVLTEFYLQDLLRRVDESSTPQYFTPSPCASLVTVVATVDSGIGGSTCAINIAYEKNHQGRKTLLLDFNNESPAISRFFDVQRINRRISPSRFGFSIGEVSELTSFGEIVVEADTFDEVVIDLGRMPTEERLISGVRIHEVLARWSVQSAAMILLLSRSDEDSLKRLENTKSILQRSSSQVKPIALLLSQSALSGRERRAIHESAERLFGRDFRHLPREARLVERAAAERSPVAHLSPKSLLAQEIASICKQESKRGR